MKQFLLFQLYGPMASWGDIAVGEQRPTAGHPSKSSVMGLLAAAKGIHRSEEALLQEMAVGYGFGVRVDSQGELLRDYHTAQVPPAKGKFQYFTRRDELLSHDLNTILSSRDYRIDARYVVALWIIDSSVRFELEGLHEALKCPEFVPYMGRKACPLAAPMLPQMVEAGNLKDAFAQFQAPDCFLPKLLPEMGVQYYWEALDTEEAGMEASMVYQRRDQTINRRRWQFTERNEYYYSQSMREVQ
ncbi:MAG: type I-E CRISPR-associated protein Cas5/CasD [Candidatus Thiodiazotropha sp.]